jgi:hypothetical protein
MVKLFQTVVAGLLVAGALGLAGCAEDTTTSGGSSVFGGTTGTGPGSGPTPTPGPTGIQVQLLASNSQMPSAGTTTIDLTAIVTDGTGQAVSGSAVVFSRGTDPSAFFTNITPASGQSDATGIVTAKLNLGANKSNRVINVTATTQGATGTTAVDVTGTTINVSGNTSLAFGASTTLTLTVTDSASVALQGFPMTITSAAGNSIAPAGGTTNSAGQVVVVVTATAGSDTLTATAAGVIKTQALTVSGSSFAFTTPAANVDIPLNTATPVSITWLTSGVPQVGQPVTFSSSRGAIVGSPSTTDGTGATPGVTVSSSTAGPAVITAQGPGGNPAATVNVNFVATTASSVAAQAVPGTVYVTTGVPSQTNNLSTISAVVRDAANNLVKNANVNFTITADPSNGSLSAGSAITDVSGTASVIYTAGSISSPQNGVQLTATVTAVGGVPVAPISDTAALTVAGQALLVRLGTDNLLQSVPPLNKKKWVAVVTDAGGNAVAGATVRFALRPGRYEKGEYDLPPPPPFTPQTWQQFPSATCANEDVNFNGILDGGEDLNGSGALEPPGVATVNPTGTTDASGIAEATITYPKNYATWVEVTLEARSGVAGNDPPTTATFVLPGLASDYTDLTVSPPGQLSPFGQSANCGDTL